MKLFHRAAIALAAFTTTAIFSAPMFDTWAERDFGLFRSQNVDLFRALPFETTTGDLVVDLKDNATPSDIAAIEAKIGAKLQRNSPNSPLFRADLNSAEVARAAANRLDGDRRVEVAEPEMIYSVPASEMASDLLFDALRSDLSKSTPRDFEDDSADIARGARPNDPRYGEQWNFQMIGAENAWVRTRGKGVVVAVLDTGVAGGKVKRGKACRDFGVTKFVEGYDFVHDDKDPFDDHGHGTHVAGTIAESTNNDEGVAGLAYEATIMPIKVLGADGSGTATDIADAIRFAADKGANVINMSLGSRFPSDIIRKACQYAQKKGVLIVCAAGNTFEEGVGYPAAFKECLAVSSVGPSGELAFYSSWGKEVAIAAPGGDTSQGAEGGILQNTNWPESAGGQGDDYYPFQGTSMASPHVAAAAALLIAQGVKDPARVREILEQTASKKSDTKRYGAGILSVSGATERAAELQGPRLRDFLIFGLGGLLLVSAFGDRRRKSVALRLAMTALLGIGFFGPDLFSNWVGADSFWNVLAFSAVLPTIAFLFAPRHSGKARIAGLKMVSALSLGIGVCLAANWHNGTIPFTEATFGQASVQWTLVNAAVVFAIGIIAAWESRPKTLPSGDV